MSWQEPNIAILERVMGIFGLRSKRMAAIIYTILLRISTIL